ncbi:hypothetical protein GCM10009000_094650 [Halobacterium noricense]
MECGLAGGDELAVESVVGDVVSGRQELSNSVAEKRASITAHVKFDGDSAALLHTSYADIVIQKDSEGRGGQSCRSRWLGHRADALPPTAKAEGTGLSPL